MVKRFIAGLFALFVTVGAFSVPAVPLTQREDFARMGAMDGFDFGPFSLPDMKTVVDSFIKKPKMTKPFHFTDAQMNELSPENVADAIEIIRPSRSNSQGNVSLKYRIQSPPERTVMSPSFEIKYVSRLEEDGVLGVGWTIDKFVMRRDSSVSSSAGAYLWNGRLFYISDEDDNYSLDWYEVEEQSDTVVISENGVRYTFVQDAGSSLFLLDNSECRGDSVLYHYDDKKLKGNSARIKSIDCVYKEDLIPHVRILFEYSGGFISEISVQTAKEKYPFTQKDVREVKENRYDRFCTYSFSRSRAVNGSRYLLGAISQRFDRFGYKSFRHSFEYYKDTASVARIDEVSRIYLDSLYSRDYEKNKSRIDSFRVDRTDLLKVVHTPLGACYTFNYGNERVLNGAGSADTFLVMNYLKINDGYHNDGPLVLNRYSYSGGRLVYPESKERSVACFDTVCTYNIGTDGYALRRMERHYIAKSGSAHSSESYYTAKEVLFDKDGVKIDEKSFAYNFGHRNIKVRGSSFYDFMVSKTYDLVRYSSGPVQQRILFGKNKVFFEVMDYGTVVFKEVLEIIDSLHYVLRRYKNRDEYVSYDLFYDERGNMIKCVMPCNSDADSVSLTYLYEYDRRFGQYQTGVVDSRGFTSHTEDYDYAVGLPRTLRDINGYVKKFSYRLNSIMDTVASPVRIDLAKKTGLSGVYSAYQIFKNGDVNLDTETSGIDRRDTVDLSLEIEISDSVKNALFSDVVKSGLVSSVYGRYPLSSSDVSALACPLVFEHDGLSFADTLLFNECFCNDSILQPYFISLVRFDESNEKNKELEASLYVDGLGREIFGKQRNSLGSNTVYNAGIYNEESRLVKVFAPFEEGGDDKDLKIIEEPEYDDYGRIIKFSYVDSIGNVFTKRYEYDAVGRILKYSDSNNSFAYNYDLLGNLLAVKDVAKGEVEKFSYDNNGNVVSRTTPAGDTISYVYEFDNLVNVTYPRISSANVTNIYGNSNSSYGRRGRVALCFNSSVVDEYFYNQQGNVSKVRRTMIEPNGKIMTYITEFFYDTWGRLLGFIYPDGEQLAYSFNSAGLPNALSGEKTYVYDYIENAEYDYLGRLNEVKFSNGMTRKLSYVDGRAVYSTDGGKDSLDGGKEISFGDECRSALTENYGIASASADGYLSSYFYDMSGDLSMNIGMSKEKVFVNGKRSGSNSAICSRHFIVNTYFEDRDSVCVKHIIFGGDMLMTKIVDSFSYGARPVRIKRAGAEVDEVGFAVNYDSLHTITANLAIQERLSLLDEDFYVEHKPFRLPGLRNSNVDNGIDNEERDIYFYGVGSEGGLSGLYDRDKNLVLKIDEDRMIMSDSIRFIPLLRDSKIMKDIDNGLQVPLFELNNKLHPNRDVFGR